MYKYPISETRLFGIYYNNPMINTEYIGYVDPGEYLASAAIREVKEETGVETEFQSIIAFRYFIFISFDFRSLNLK